MTIPAGYKQVNSLVLEQAMTEEAEVREEKKRREQARAGAYAHVCHSLGISVRQMTPAQRAFADATARRWAGEGDTTGKGYGFTLPGRTR